MKKEVIVISLGGSKIIDNSINTNYLKSFKKLILKYIKKYNFIIVCGGGNLARDYISAIKKIKGTEDFQSYVGINATRANARFVSYFFGYNPTFGIPRTFKTLKKYLKKRGIVFCGALEYKKNQTTDSTAARIAKKFNTNFINVTNVSGLYSKDPRKSPKSKLIKEISFKEFEKKANTMKFSAGQHFVLDQKAAKIIRRNKIKTFILEDVKELEKVLLKKEFVGTIINSKFHK